jgi:sRNA-binding regulator protein Hfq
MSSQPVDRPEGLLADCRLSGGGGDGWGFFLAVLVILSAAAPGPTSAHEKTDVVVLTNGDRFHGEIKKVAQGTLTLDTDSADTITFKWAYIASLVSEFPFQVHTTGGRDCFGTLAVPDQPGEIKVVGPSETHVVALSDVFFIMPMEQSFWLKLDGSIDFGFSYVQSTKAVQYNLSSNVRYRASKIIGDLQLHSRFSTQEDAESASQQDLSLVLLRPVDALEGKGNLFVLGQLQSNPNQGFDLRTVGGGGFGVFVEEKPTGFSLLSAGMVVARENVTSSSQVDTNAEALLSFRFVRYQTDFPRRRFSVGVNTFTSITNSPRFRVQASLSLSWEIIRSLIVSLNFLDYYDSNPPTADAVKNDSSLSTTLGYSF